MGLFDFVQDAGEKVFGKSAKSKEEANREQAALLRERVERFGFPVEDFGVDYFDDTATVKGFVPSQAMKEKIVLLVGNTQGVARVNDLIRVKKQEIVDAAPEKQVTGLMSESMPEPEATFYTVKPGDSLSKIAKEVYGNAMKYPEIFEANKPMITDPNKIYPGQVLRIPPAD